MWMRKKLIELLMDFHCETNFHICDGCGSKSAEDVCGDIADYLIANDVIIQVRCKDCKHYLWHDWDYSYCCIKLGRFVKPDFGCLYGERKDNEEQT